MNKNKNKLKKIIISAFFSLFYLVPAHFQEAELNKEADINAKPVIIKKEKLSTILNTNHRDFSFLQFSQTVLENKKNIRAGKPIFMEFYLLKNKKNMDLLSISASLNIPYDTIASLNSIESSKANLSGKNIVIPAFEGIFIPVEPKTPVEILNYKSMEEKELFPFERKFILDGKEFYFFSGEARFSSSARAYFLDSIFRMPLDEIKITSEYGFRQSPVYHKWKMHGGVDFEAKEGTKVYSVQRGTVHSLIKNDKIFGNCLIIDHGNGIKSVYAHLSKFFVHEGQLVQGGHIIALSGSTGAVTGPHLHFEIRTDNVSQNPIDFLMKKQK